MIETVNQGTRSGHASRNTSFDVTVCCKQNATWQGQIHWVEKNQDQNFRSALEMLKLMDEALSEGADEEKIGWEK